MSPKRVIRVISYLVGGGVFSGLILLAYAQVPGAPQISTLSPNSMGQGAASRALTVNGTNFVQGTTADIASTEDLLARDSFILSNPDRIVATSSSIRLKNTNLNRLPEPFGDYRYRRQITLPNTSTTTMPSGYSVKVLLDHAALVTGGRSRPDGNDVRIGYRDPLRANVAACTAANGNWDSLFSECWFDLNRVAETSWDNLTSPTEIWFATRAAVSGNITDTNYYIYYGNSEAGSPPASRSQVYILYEDFSAPLSGWTETGSNLTAFIAIDNNGRLRIPGGDRATYPIAGVTPGAIFMEYDYAFDNPTSGLSCNGLGSNFVRPNQFRQLLYLPRANGQCAGIEGDPSIPVTWVQGPFHRIRQEWWGTGTNQYRLSVDNMAASRVGTLSNTAAITSISFNGGDTTTNGPALVDNIVVRKYVNPEPVLALGPEGTVSQPVYSSTPETATSPAFGSGQSTLGWQKMLVATSGTLCTNCVARIKVASSTDGSDPIIPGTCPAANCAPLSPGKNVINLGGLPFNTFNTGDPSLNRFRIQIELSGNGAEKGLEIIGLRLWYANGGRISNSSCTVPDSSRLVCTASIDSTTTTGPKDVLVAGSNGVATCLGCFTVNPAPVISSVTPVSPNNLGQGATSQNITINGSNFSSQAGTQVIFTGGSGVTVHSVTYNSTNQLTANVTVASNATVGAWGVTVINPDSGVGSRDSVLTVNLGPRVRATSPASAVPGTSNLDLTIQGENFSNIGGTPTVRFSGGGITPAQSSATFIDTQTLHVTISIAADAAEGPRDITVVNPDQGTGTGVGVFQVGFLPAGTIPAMISYGESGANNPRFRRWNGVEWSSEASAPAGTSDPRQVVLASSPTRDEKVLGVIGMDRSLQLQVWNGAAWNGSVQATPSSGVVTHPTRSFDIAYEQQSGRTLVVYGETGSMFPRYRVWNGASWSAAATVPIVFTNGVPITTGVPVWMVLKANPNNNEILLVYQDTNQDIGALVWNGSAFVAQSVILLEGNTTTTEAQTFDAAYDAQSGNAMVAWARSGSGTPRFKIWDRTQSQWGPEQQAGLSAETEGTDLRFVRLVADPSSQRMALATSDANSDLYAQVLSGSGTTWTASGTGAPVRLTDNLAFSRYQRAFDLAWEKVTSKLLAAYSIADNPGGSFRTWTAGTGWSSEPGNIPTPTGVNAAVVQLHSNPKTDDIMAAVLDTNLYLTLARWNGFTGTDIVTVETNVSGSQSLFDSQAGTFITVYPEAFMLSYDQYHTGSRLIVTGITPNGLLQGASNQNIQISGEGFVSGAGVTFTKIGGTGVTVNSVTVNSPSLLTVNVTLSATATVGPWDITILNPSPDNQQVILSGLFNVLPMPEITSVTPNALGQGAEHRVLTISGQGFQTGATVSFSGTGVALSPVCRTLTGCIEVSPSQIRVEVSVDANAGIGPRSLTITNLNPSQTNTKTNALMINTKPIPSTVSPSTRPSGSLSQELTITGTDFRDGATLDLSRISRDLIETPSSFIFSDSNAIGIESGVLRLKSMAETGSFPVPFTNYLYRRPLLITAAAEVPADYSVRLTLDHAALVAEGSSLDTGDDVRIGYRDPSHVDATSCTGAGGYWDTPLSECWFERDRLAESGWNLSNTEIWFRTQAGIPAGGVDRQYYIYFGNSTATAPATGPNDVFILWEDFEGGLTGWTDTAQALQIVNGQLIIPGGDRATHTVTGLSQGAVFMEYDYAFDNPFLSGLSCNGLGSNFVRPNQVRDLLYLPNANGSCAGVLGDPSIPVTWVNRQFHRIRQEWWGTLANRYRLSVDNLAESLVGTLSNTTAIDNVSFQGGDDATKGPALVDNIVVRKYVNPEPTMSQVGYSTSFQTAAVTFGGGQVSEWDRLDVTTIGSICPTDPNCHLYVKYASSSDGVFDGNDPYESMEGVGTCNTTRCKEVKNPDTICSLDSVSGNLICRIPLDAPTGLNLANNRLKVQVEIQGSSDGQNPGLGIDKLVLKFKAQDITVSSCIFDSSTQLRCTVSLNNNPLQGDRDLAVVNPDGGVGTTNAHNQPVLFTVSPPVGLTPTVSSISPTTITQGEVGRRVTITGTNFYETPSVTFGRTGIRANSVTFVNSGTLDVLLEVDQNAGTGNHSVTVTNPNGLSNTLSTALTVQALETQTLTGGTTTTLLCSSNRWAYQDLTVASGGILALNCNGMTLKVYGTLVVQSNGRIHADEIGYSGGGPNTQGNGPGGGAAGGQGGSHLAYDYTSMPTDLGSGGGGGDSNGGAGGGAIRITANTLTLNGVIRANGAPGFSNTNRAGGGGSGGSLWVDAVTLQGTGRFEALGGAGGSGISPGGGGTGGRLAIYYRTNSMSFAPSSAAGGLGGAGSAGAAGPAGFAGSVLFADQGATPNSLVVGGYGQLDGIFTGDQTFQAITVRPGGTSPTDLNSVASFTVWSNLTILGDLRVQSGGGLRLVGARTVTAQNLQVDAGGSIQADGTGHAGGSRDNCGDTQGGSAQGPGAGGGETGCTTTLLDMSGAGGGYGGRGGDGRGDTNFVALTRGGNSYGSAEVPLDLGSGGGRSYFGRSGGSGGGAIRLEVTGTLTLNGIISAHGNPGAGGGPNVTRDFGGGGGSGGSIYAVVNTLQGSGYFEARGGNGGPRGTGTTNSGEAGGGGGGGRIAVNYNALGTTGFTGFTCPQGSLPRDSSFCVWGGLGQDGVRAGTTGTIRFILTDTLAPSAPSGLMASAVSTSQINLSWTASTDNAGVTGYRVERCQGDPCVNFAQITTTTTTTYSDLGLDASTVYSYRVQAVDAANNLSPYSNTVSVSTLGPSDTLAPSAPSNLTASAASTSQINLTWTASTDNVGVTGYRLERCQGAGCTNFFEIATPTSTSYSDKGFNNAGLEAGTSYSYQVRAGDAANNLSDYSNIATATTLTSADGSPPQPINDLRVVLSSINSNSAVLEWKARQDDTATEPATAFEVRYATFPINDSNFNSANLALGSPIPGPPGTLHTFRVSGLASNTIYYFAIKAVDEGGNSSAISTLINSNVLNSNLQQDCSPQCKVLTALRIGWNFVSVPTQPQSPNNTADAVFGDDVDTPVNLYRWNSGSIAIGTGRWENLGSTTGGTNGPVEAGKGYFLYSLGNLAVIDTVINVPGTGLVYIGRDVTDPTYQLLLDPDGGFNMVSNPYKIPIRLQDLCVRSPFGITASFVEAMQTLGWVDNALYIWRDDQDSYSMETINQDDLADPNNPVLLPWKGYSIRMAASGGYSIIFRNPSVLPMPSCTSLP